MEVFHPSVESEWQQVSLSLQDSSLQSEQCCSLDGLYLSFYFQVLQSLHQSFGDCTTSNNTNGITVTFTFHSFSVLSQDPGIYLPSVLLYGQLEWQNPLSGWFSFFFVDYLVIYLRLDDLLLSQNPTEYCASRFPGWIMGCAYIVCLYGQI